MSEKRSRNKEYDREYSVRYFRENRESEIARNAEWRKANRERRNAYMREWNRDKSKNDPINYRAQRRKHSLKRKYGLTQEQYDQILASQNGHCALCDSGPEQERYKALNVDHCHETGKIRGLLCSTHNLAIGRLGDTEEAIANVLRYLMGSGA